MRILVTGGAGYIGSHTCVELLAAGHEVSIYDNFCNSAPAVVERIGAIAGKVPALITGDVRDRAALAAALRASNAEAVVHFAGLKAVGESVTDPLRYYDNNVVGMLRLLEAMNDHGCRTVVFSSSATVYGEPQWLPYTETHPLSATNPYGRSKLMIEDILRDLHVANPAWRIGLLRYFNPVGAHPSGDIGEDPQGTPNNLMPFIAQVAVGRREFLNIWGGDYATPDGTGQRDYIHVVDLALGHVRALDYLATQGGLLTVNLGAGVGHSVLDMVKAFERASGRPIPYRIAERRPGDLPAYHADPSLAESLLGWKASRSIDDMCADTWCWQSRNPEGYRR